MKTLGKMVRLVACAALVTTSGFAFAEGGDSSADSGSFTDTVKASKGVVIRVPVNERGEELTSAAELHVYTGDLAISQANAQDTDTAFALGAPATGVPAVSQADIDRDSSTSWGWRGGYRGNGSGWYNNYYYSYRPSYYYGGNYYNYGNPYYYSNYGGYYYGGSYYYGYRNYYYPYYH